MENAGIYMPGVEIVNGADRQGESRPSTEVVVSDKDMVAKSKKKKKEKRKKAKQKWFLKSIPASTND